MRDAARDRVTHHFQTFLSNPSNFDYTPALRHWASVALGDLVVDCAAILAGYGEAFLRRFYKQYPQLPALLHRAHFYLGTFALQEALYGIEHDDSEAFERGIAEYR